MNEKKLNRIIKETVSEVLNETSRRQKATKKFLGANNMVKTFGIITGENPMGMKYGGQENEKRNGMLTSFLKSKQYLFYQVKGKYGNIEHPLMVYNVSLEDMKTIGHTFDQESFIYAEIDNEQGQPHVTFSYYKKDFSETEKINGGKKIKPSDREYHFIEKKDNYVQLDADAEDYFTAIGRNFKFSIPFDIFNEAIDNYNNFVNERCDRYEKYKWLCEKRITESVQSERTEYYRRLKRAELYGTNYEKFL